MTLLAVLVIVSWLWMLATSFHFDDVHTEVRRPSLLMHQPAPSAPDAGMPTRRR